MCVCALFFSSHETPKWSTQKIDTRHNEIDERLLLNEWNPNEAAVRFGLDSVEWVYMWRFLMVSYRHVCHVHVCMCAVCRLSFFFSFPFVVVRLFLIAANFVITILCYSLYRAAPEPGLQYFLTPISSACDEVAKINIVLERKHNEINSA